MKKRVLAMMLATTLMTTLLAGCGQTTQSGEESVVSESKGSVEGEGESGTEEVNEVKPVTISMLYSDSATEPYNPEWKLWDWIEEATGVTFEFTIVPTADYVAKRELVFNSGEIPDIVAHTTAEASWISAGLLLPVSDYEDQMPNFKSFIEEAGYTELLDNTRQSNGKFYSLPMHATDYIFQEIMWLIRTDIFEKNDIEIPTDYQDLLTAGQTLLELYPESTPITNRFGTDHLCGGLSRIFGLTAGWAYGNGVAYDFDAKEWYFTATTDAWREYLTFTHELYETGVLDKEYSTLDSTIYEQRIVMGETFMMYDWAANIDRYNPQGQEVDPDYNVSPIYPVKGPYGDYSIGSKSGWGLSCVLPASLAKDEEHLADVLRYLDWGYTEEAKVLLTFGVEGETFEVVDGLRLATTTTAKADYGLNSTETCMRQDVDVFLGVFSPEQRAIFEQIGEDGIIPMVTPSSPLSADQVEETTIYNTALTDYVKSMMEKFISGETSMDYWDTYVEECVAKGSERLIAEYEKAVAAQ